MSDTILYSNCKISELCPLIVGSFQTNLSYDKILYQVYHMESGHILHTITRTEAIKVARLLELQYQISTWMVNGKD